MPELPGFFAAYYGLKLQQVSTNGLILFSDPSGSLTNVRALPTCNLPLVAALWEDFDFRASGSMFFRTATNKSDATLLDSVASKISQMNPDLSGFRPTLVVVVTWFEAILFSGQFSNSTVSKSMKFDVYETDQHISAITIRKKRPFPHSQHPECMCMGSMSTHVLSFLNLFSKHFKSFFLQMVLCPLLI